MATWNKIRFYWSTMLGSTGSTLTATSTASGFTLTDIYNMLETYMWKSAVTTNPQYITYDAGVGNTATADYLAIIGHNLKTIGATIVLQYSATGAWAGEEVDAFTAFAPSADTVILKEFTAPAAKRYWRLKISGTMSAAPYMTICIWGNKTELDYASMEYDPHEFDDKATVNLSQGGYMSGTHIQFSERSISLQFDDADSTLYNKVKEWREVNRLNNVFVAWETANNPSDVWLMRPDSKFSNPFKLGGAYRTIRINLKGRKE